MQRCCIPTLLLRPVLRPVRIRFRKRKESGEKKWREGGRHGRREEIGRKREGGEKWGREGG